jgi:hypothetical protein
MSFFHPARQRAGDGAVRISLDDLRLAIEGLDAPLADDLFARYSPYTDPPDDTGHAQLDGRRAEVGEMLRISFGLEAREYFIEPPERPETNPVLLACDGERIRYLGYQVAGWFDARGGSGQILLSRGRYEPPGRAIENYVRAAVAWQAASRGGALVHSASAVLNGKGYLFYGPSGAGKSTLSACNTRAQVVSDDLSLVLPRPGGGLDLVGSPFRGTYTGGAPVVGRFPLVAGFRIVKDTISVVRPAPRVRVFAGLVANLPFVADAFKMRPDMFESMERAFADLPLANLHFRKDDSYWEAIARAGY